jgi:hypothetical protein
MNFIIGKMWRVWQKVAGNVLFGVIHLLSLLCLWTPYTLSARQKYENGKWRIEIDNTKQ